MSGTLQVPRSDVKSHTNLYVKKPAITIIPERQSKKIYLEGQASTEHKDQDKFKILINGPKRFNSPFCIAYKEIQCRWGKNEIGEGDTGIEKHRGA